MSALLSRAADRSADRGGSGLRSPFAASMRSLPGWQAGLLAAVWSAASVLLPLQLLALIGWVASGTDASPFDAIAVGSYGWLAGHGVPLTLPGDPATAAVSGVISLRPLGMFLVVSVLLYRAGSWAARVSGPASSGAVGMLTAEIALVYGALAVGVAVLTQDGPAQPSVVVSALAGLVVAGLAAGLGALRGAGLLAALRNRQSVDLRVALDAGGGALLVLVAGAGLVLALSLVAHFARVVGLAGALDPGFTGWLVLLVLNLVLLPNAAAYALSFAAGPGFAVGVGTSVSLGGTSVGPMPALSIIGALPEGSAAPPYAYAVLLVPIAAGVTAGLLAVTRAPRAQAERAAIRAAAAGLVAGVGTALLTWAAGGGVGSGQLSSIGPNPLLVGLVVTVEVGVLAAVTAWLACPRAAAAGAAAGGAAGVSADGLGAPGVGAASVGAATSVAQATAPPDVSASAGTTADRSSEGADLAASHLAPPRPVPAPSAVVGTAVEPSTAQGAIGAPDEEAPAALSSVTADAAPSTGANPAGDASSGSSPVPRTTAAAPADAPDSERVAARVRGLWPWSRRGQPFEKAASADDAPSSVAPAPANVSPARPTPSIAARRRPSTPVAGSLKPAPSPFEEPAAAMSDDDGPRSRPDALPEETVVFRRVVND